jgi:hypothetical protein
LDDGTFDKPTAEDILVAVTDAFEGIDDVSVVAAVAISDSGTGSDDVTVTVILSLDDAGEGVEDLLARVQVAVDDFAEGLDLEAPPTVSLALEDSGALTDAIEAINAACSVSDDGEGADYLYRHTRRPATKIILKATAACPAIRAEGHAPTVKTEGKTPVIRLKTKG